MKKKGKDLKIEKMGMEQNVSVSQAENPKPYVLIGSGKRLRAGYMRCVYQARSQCENQWKRVHILGDERNSTARSKRREERSVDVARDTLRSLSFRPAMLAWGEKGQGRRYYWKRGL